MRKFNVVVNGKAYEVDVEELGGDNTSSVSSAPVVAPATEAKPAAPAGGTAVKAPMPGLILSLSHADGDSVKKDDKVCVLEAMKMENDIFAPAGGTITYAVKKGDNIDTGAVIAYIK